ASGTMRVRFARRTPAGAGPGRSIRLTPRSSVAQWQSIRLLTGGLLVRVQPEEPFSRSAKMAPQAIRREARRLAHARRQRFRVQPEEPFSTISGQPIVRLIFTLPFFEPISCGFFVGV